MVYNWQLKTWPHFSCDLNGMQSTLLKIAEKAGRLSGLLTALPETTQKETVVDIMIAEAIKSSAIEGEFLNRSDVRSSLRNQLGLNKKKENVRDNRAQGIAEMLVNVQNEFSRPLTQKILFYWHALLMQGHRDRIIVGGWRKGNDPMQVISGPIGKWKVHFEAPPSGQVPKEMKRFIDWFNQTAPGQKHEMAFAPVRAAVAHLYFESIHPFDDGNGRIGRALSEKALSQHFGYPCLMSLSKAIESDKKLYYKTLETAQKSNTVTLWISYFIDTILKAQIEAEKLIDFVLAKARFFDRYRMMMNERQLKIVRRMFEEGPGGFEGGMTAKKYISLTKVSKATATRDLQQLVQIGALIPIGSGRSVRYDIRCEDVNLSKMVI